MPTDSKEKRGKNKMGEYFPVYSISSSKTDIVFTKIMKIGKASTTTGKKSTKTGTASTGSLKGNYRCHWIFWNQQMIFFRKWMGYTVLRPLTHELMSLWLLIYKCTIVCIVIDFFLKLSIHELYMINLVFIWTYNLLEFAMMLIQQ